MITLNKPSEYPKTPLQDIYNDLYETFTDDEYDKNEDNRTLLSPIVTKGKFA